MPQQPAGLISWRYACNFALQVVPILRAGLVLVEQISTVLPSQVTYHVGLVRNEDTLQVSCMTSIQLRVLRCFF